MADAVFSLQVADISATFCFLISQGKRFKRRGTVVEQVHRSRSTYGGEALVSSHFCSCLVFCAITFAIR